MCDIFADSTSGSTSGGATCGDATSGGRHDEAHLMARSSLHTPQPCSSSYRWTDRPGRDDTVRSSRARTWTAPLPACLIAAPPHPSPPLHGVPPVAISTAFHHTLRTVCKSRLSLCCMRRVRAGLSCSDVEPSPTHPWRDAWQRGARRRGARGRARRVASGGFASPRLCVPVGVPGRASSPTPRLAAVSARAGRRRDRWLENDAAAPVRCCMVYG